MPFPVKTFEDLLTSPPEGAAKILCSPATVHLFADRLKKEKGFKKIEQDLSKKADFAFGEIPMFATERVQIGVLWVLDKDDEPLGVYRV
jgi:hypothetical protein